MEKEKLIIALKENGFTNDPDKISTVLETRAYHNRGYNGLTDTSYGVIKLRPLINSSDPEVIESCIDLIADLLLSVYPQLPNESKYMPENGNNPFLWVRDLNECGRVKNMQFAFTGCLTKEEIISKIILLIDFALDFLQKQKTKSDSVAKELTNVSKCLNVAKLFILNGSVSYEKQIENYDIFD